LRFAGSVGFPGLPRPKRLGLARIFLTFVHEQSYFTGRKMPPTTLRQVAERNRPDLDAHQANDRMTDHFHHAPYLTIAPFMENNFKQVGSGFLPFT
jgi:hypothetical protein